MHPPERSPEADDYVFKKSEEIYLQTIQKGMAK
jgi:hypothetical protein